MVEHKIWQAREELLSAALRVLSSRISSDLRPENPWADTENEYASEGLTAAAMDLVRALGWKLVPDES